jgi:uncharacterized protein YndB with AHSA1/START domain
VTAAANNATEFRTITINRVIDAPRSLVFEAMIDPKHLVHWFHASDDWSTPYAKTDPKKGGKFDIGFAGPDGKLAFAFEGEFTEVTPPSKLTYVIGDGRPVIITLGEAGKNKTNLEVILALENTNPEAQQREGWTEMFINLGKYLATLN